MENRKTTKQIEVNRRKFILNKFTPYFGVYLAVQTFGSFAGKENKLAAISEALLSKPQEEFIKLQQDVLKYCSEILPGGKIPVVNEEGNFAVENMDAPLALNLFVQTLFFSMSDFFTEAVMTDLEKSLKGAMEEVLPQES